MYNQIQFGADPTVWLLSEEIDDGALAQAGPPLTLTVTHPVPGTLLVSGRSLASALLTQLSLPHGGIPQPGETPSATSYLYLASGSGCSPASPGYALAAGTDLAGLQTTLTNALTGEGTCVLVPLRNGALVLNGATVAFAAILRTA